jgi:23S rRNA G2069 N7-methylase RlmK/C1962 C5-methylase RlmI
METLIRYARRKESFGIIVVDPPSFSRSKSRGSFSVKRDMEELVQQAASLIEKSGWLFCSSNLAEW